MSSISSREQELEQSLKGLLQKILLCVEKFLDNTEELQNIESELKDYDDLHELVSIITTVFNKLSEKVDIKFGSQQQPIVQIPKKKSTDYDKLESIIQKHEDEIRQHIRTEQQMQLFAEQLQNQLDESEETRKEFLKQTTKMINSFKRENVTLMKNLKQVNLDNQYLCKKIHDIGENQKVYDDKLIQIPEMKEQIQSLLQLVQRNQKLPRNLSKEALKDYVKHQSGITLHKDSSDMNQSTEYAGVSQVSTKFGGLTNSGSTPLKYARKKPSDKGGRVESNRAFKKEDLSQLQRQRGVSMNIKRDLSMYYGEHQQNSLKVKSNKSHSIVKSKPNSQDNSINFDYKKYKVGESAHKVTRRNSVNERSLHKPKFYQYELKKSQIKC